MPKPLLKMKRGARIVNCARGELIDEDALQAAMQRRLPARHSMFF